MAEFNEYEYNKIVEGFAIDINSKIGIEECDADSMLSLVMEIINKTAILIGIMEPQYNQPFNPTADDSWYQEVILAKRIESVMDDISTETIQNDYVMCMLDIIYGALNEEDIEYCYSYIKKFVREHKDEMGKIEYATYGYVAKMLSDYLRNTGYYDKMLVNNVRLT